MLQRATAAEQVAVARVTAWQLALLVVLLVAVYRARGNVAHLFGSN